MKTIADHRFRRISATTIAMILSLAAAAPGFAQDMPFIDAAHGTVLIHGNYCGPGNRAPRPPVDALDLACMHHDACSPPRGKLATCSCNERLHREAEAVANDEHQPQSLRDTAGFVSDTAMAMPCD